MAQSVYIQEDIMSKTATKTTEPKIETRYYCDVCKAHLATVLGYNRATDTGLQILGGEAHKCATHGIRYTPDWEVPPVVGMGATELHWTDRSPYTVIEVSASGKSCKVQRNTYRRVDDNGMSETQTYIYADDPTGEIVTLRKGKRGWVSKGRRFSIGNRRAYRDFSF